MVERSTTFAAIAPPGMVTRPTSEKVSSFLQWFEALESSEQEVLMAMVYKEKRIRDVVNSLGGMAQEQRQEVFQRLGLPVDLVARIPPPDPAALNDVEVEWEDWKAPGTT
jgi:hypothetical protein